MKKIIVLLSVLFLSILLVGCISIPLGDGGKLEVSKDGVNVDLGEEEESIGDEIEVVEEDVEGPGPKKMQQMRMKGRKKESPVKRQPDQSNNFIVRMRFNSSNRRWKYRNIGRLTYDNSGRRR